MCNYKPNSAIGTDWKTRRENMNLFESSASKAQKKAQRRAQWILMGGKEKIFGICI